ncbi:putative prolyl 4-hydroxylase [Trifolium repens]|nr:putative prolyl 4-hydroxylase [Trifolium repens]
MQVLRYEKNQYYRPHHDYFSDTFNLKRGGQRIATMLMYLGDNVEGGETHFPSAGSDGCSCGGKLTKGLCVKPIKGNTVLFWSMGLDGQSDPDSVHGGCPVLAGEKWSATKWMRQSVHDDDQADTGCCCTLKVTAEGHNKLKGDKLQHSTSIHDI